jgi:REP element-mobilizing transposase RayT
MCALQIGGMPDHVHILLSMPAALSLAEGMRHLKGVSSWWMHHELGRGNFGWQEGYGAFSIGVAQIEATRQYIERQTEHHQKRDYKAEFLAMLQRHGLTYDERYLWS